MPRSNRTVVRFRLFGNVYIGRTSVPWGEIVRIKNSRYPHAQLIHIRVTYLNGYGEERVAHVYPDAILEELHEDG